VIEFWFEKYCGFRMFMLYIGRLLVVGGVDYVWQWVEVQGIVEGVQVVFRKSFFEKKTEKDFRNNIFLQKF